MPENTLVFVDIETNGLTGSRGRILEVAAIKVQGLEIMDRFTSFVNPGTDVPAFITQLTGITTKDVVTAPYFSDIAPQLHAFMDGCIFAAHHVLFDYSFLKREFKLAGYDFRPPLFCTVKMSRALYPGVRGHSLQKIIERHDIVTEQRHRALADAQAMLDFYRITHKLKGASMVAENLQQQTQSRSLPPTVDSSVIAALPERPGIYIFEDANGFPLYIGKSVNIKKRVKSHFTQASMVAKEMNLSLRSHHVSFEETDTELEALLLESQRIKEMQPLLNRKLRRKQNLYQVISELDTKGYQRLQIERTPLGTFTTRAKALAAIESAMKAYQLCPALCGLEKSQGACFRRQLGMCRGACVGLEPANIYNQRAEQAIGYQSLAAWPHRGPVGIPLTASKTIIVDKWLPIALIENDSINKLHYHLDPDLYKIMRAFLRGAPQITPIDPLLFADNF